MDKVNIQELEGLVTAILLKVGPEAWRDFEGIELVAVDIAVPKKLVSFFHGTAREGFSDFIAYALGDLIFDGLKARALEELEARLGARYEKRNSARLPV